MRLNALALLVSAAVISAAPVPKPQAIVPVPVALQSPTVLNDATAEGVLDGTGLGNLPVLTPVLNVVDGLVDTLKGALPAELVKQLKTALGPALGPIEKLPILGSIVASLLGDDPLKVSWNATALDQSQIVAHLPTVHAPPSSLAAAVLSTSSGAAPTSVAAVASATASPSSLYPFSTSLPGGWGRCESLDIPDPCHPCYDYLGNLLCPPGNPYGPGHPPPIAATG